MARYSYWNGKIQFKDQYSYDRAREIITNWFRKESPLPKNKDLIFDIKAEISHIDMDQWRNFHRVINAINEELEYIGNIVGYTDDGEESGFFCHNGIDNKYSLSEWASEYLPEELHFKDLDPSEEEFHQTVNIVSDRWYEQTDQEFYDLFGIVIEEKNNIEITNENAWLKALK
jgi:hypothetical protein